MRFTLRTAFVAFAIAGFACAWFAKQAAVRSFELSRIKEITAVSGAPVFIGDGEHPFGGCGSYRGIIIYVEDCGPSLLKPLRLDCVKRVTGIEMKCQNKPELLDIAAALSSLKDVCVEKDSPDNVDFIAAIESFSNRRPLVSVDYWHSEY